MKIGRMVVTKKSGQPAHVAQDPGHPPSVVCCLVELEALLIQPSGFLKIAAIDGDATQAQPDPGLF